MNNNNILFQASIKIAVAGVGPFTVDPIFTSGKTVRRPADCATLVRNYDGELR